MGGGGAGGGWGIEIVIAKSVEPDQTPRFAAFDLYLRFLVFPLYGVLAINRLNQSTTD